MKDKNYFRKLACTNLPQCQLLIPSDKRDRDRAHFPWEMYGLLLVESGDFVPFLYLLSLSCLQLEIINMPM